MIYIILNIMPIAFATLAALLIDALWLAIARLPRPGTVTLIAMALLQFWFAAILAGALILAPPKADPWIMAVGSAVVIWIGFVMPAVAVGHLVRRGSNGALITDCLAWLAIMVVEAVVLKTIGLVPPPVG